MAVVQDALLVAGGLGTRMLPTSASVPKEALPLVDVPALVHLAREAVAAGARRLHIISSPRKDMKALIGDHAWLQEKRPDIDPQLLSPFADVEVFIHIQHEPLGLGNAIECALDQINGPFLVLLGDNILLDQHTSPNAFSPSKASKKLVENFETNGLPCVGLLTVHPDEVSRYGVVRQEGERILEICEKPLPENAPSNLVLCGRYLFTADAKKLLQHYDVETYGELQSIALQQHWMKNDGLLGVELSNFQWYDSGKPLPWLQAQVDHALRRNDLSTSFRAWLHERLAED
jgi:UTP--glucose-1-phosphate uridylyltransferase|tara:strand:+ start:1329 stop:2195 length:867 start_codon:yes stop_codon:yes gene_type:complete